jgi:hypothetical protein
MKYISDITQSFKKRSLFAFMRSHLKMKRIKSRLHKKKYPIYRDKIYKTPELNINTASPHIHSENEDLDFHKTHTSRLTPMIIAQKKQVPAFNGPYQVVHRGEDRCILINMYGRDKLYCESSYDISNYI